MHYVTVKGILSAENGMNLYRGCTHGCIYCDSRSDCYRMNHAFEDIEVKENALQLLEDTLHRKRKACMISTGSMSDPYMPLEMKLEQVRKAIQLVDRYGHGFTVTTKSNHVLRDIELMQQINDRTKCVLQMTLTTCDDELSRRIEPNVCPTSARFATLKRFRECKIPTVVWLSPILPYINDTVQNITGILDMCAEAGVYGVICFGMGLTLRSGNREYYYRKLDELFPGLKQLYIQKYALQYVVNSPYNNQLMHVFHETCERYGLVHNNDLIFQYLSSLPERNEQISLWDHL